MAVSTAGRAPPEVLAKTIGVLGRLRFADEQVIDSLARHLMPGIQHLQPNVMHELVRGAAGGCMLDAGDLSGLRLQWGQGSRRPACRRPGLRAGPVELPLR